MRRVAVAALVLLLAAPAAEGRKPRLHGTVSAGRYGKAPRSWKVRPGWPAPAPAATPAPDATATPAPTPEGPGSALPPANPRSVSVNATEYAFTLSQPAVSAGDVRIQFDNSRAEDSHQLAIDPPAGDRRTFGVVRAGDVAQHTVTLQPGRHVLLCPLPQHEELGMRAVLTVR